MQYTGSGVYNKDTYFWGAFDNEGIKYGHGSIDSPNNLAGSANLTTDPLKDNGNNKYKADFSNGDGDIQFEVINGEIVNIFVTIKGTHNTGTSSGIVGTETTFECQFENK